MTRGLEAGFIIQANYNEWKGRVNKVKSDAYDMCMRFVSPKG